MTTYYRIQQADRDTADLLDPEQQVSYNWNDANDLRDCPDCDGRGYDLEGDCPDCDGEGTIDNVRVGVSTCASLDDLYAYIRISGADPTDAVIVEMYGYHSDDQAEDAEVGEHLIHPTDILSVTPVTDDIIDRIYNEE